MRGSSSLCCQETFPVPSPALPTRPGNRNSGTLSAQRPCGHCPGQWPELPLLTVPQHSLQSCCSWRNHLKWNFNCINIGTKTCNAFSTVSPRFPGGFSTSYYRSDQYSSARFSLSVLLGFKLPVIILPHFPRSTNVVWTLRKATKPLRTRC